MVFQVLGYAPQAKWTTHQPVIDRTLKSFAVLTDATALAVQPQRLSVITLDRASSLAELKARRRPDDAHFLRRRRVMIG